MEQPRATPRFTREQLEAELAKVEKNAYCEGLAAEMAKLEKEQRRRVEQERRLENE